MEIEVNGLPDRDVNGNLPNNLPQSIPDNSTQAPPDAVSEQPAADQPLRKIHAKHHSTGRYKMFSNHASANDFPRTSTGA